MQIRSNIEGVIGRLKALEKALPEAVAAAAAPGYWKRRFTASAERTLAPLWALTRDLELRSFYERMAPRIVATIVGEAFERGSYFTMFIPEDAMRPEVSIGKAAEYAIGTRTPTGRVKKEVINRGVFDPDGPDKSNRENVDLVRQTILDWVALEKNRGPQDYKEDGTPYSDEEIAARLEVILGLRPHETLGNARTEIMKNAAEGLTRALQSWLDGECATSPEMAASLRGAGHLDTVNSVGIRPGSPNMTFDPKVAEQWLAAVMADWKLTVFRSMPDRLRDQVDKVFARIKTELPLTK